MEEEITKFDVISVKIKAKKPVGYISGFAPLLSFWFLEHTTLIAPYSNKLRPRIMRWEVRKFWNSKEFDYILSNLKSDQVLDTVVDIYNDEIQLMAEGCKSNCLQLVEYHSPHHSPQSLQPPSPPQLQPPSPPSPQSLLQLPPPPPPTENSCTSFIEELINKKFSVLENLVNEKYSFIENLINEKYSFIENLVNEKFSEVHYDINFLKQKHNEMDHRIRSLEDKDVVDDGEEIITAAQEDIARPSLDSATPTLSSYPQAKLLSVANELGHEIRVFTNSATSGSSNEVSAPSNDEPDEFYDFTPEDYYRSMGDKLGAQSQILKTRKIREAEAAARRSRVTKAVIRVRFPDNYILEAKFQPSEKIHSLVDLLLKVIARPDLPFFLYTTPPKEQIKDFSKDFYSAGFAPGAIVYFSYDLPKDSELNAVASPGPYLREDIMSLNGLDYPREQIASVNSEREIPIVDASHDVSEPSQPAKKKQTKPKWLKL